MVNDLSFFLKQMRKRWHLSQQELAERSGVGLRFIRSIEQGKESLMMDKVNQVLSLFECELTPTLRKECDVMKREFVYFYEMSQEPQCSYEMYARLVVHSSFSSLKLFSFWKRVLFSWMTACVDVLYKDLFVSPDRRLLLPVSPSYDLLLDKLEMPTCGDDLPMYLNGKKRLIERNDWVEAMVRSGLERSEAESLVEWGVEQSEAFKRLVRSLDVASSVKEQAMKRIVYNRLLLRSVL